jgi:hypothetical protein
VNGKGKHNVEKDDKKPFFFNQDPMSKKKGFIQYMYGDASALGARRLNGLWRFNACGMIGNMAHTGTMRAGRPRSREAWSEDRVPYSKNSATF